MLINQKIGTRVEGAAHIAKILQSVLKAEHETDKMKEHFWVVGLNRKNIISYLELVSLGGLDSATVHPRETFRFAIMKAVSSIILVHNHPSGDTHPSEADDVMTQKLKQAGKILGIEVLDHLIITKGKESYYSYRESSGLFRGIK